MLGRGFTLIELLVTISIIAVLISILVSALGSAMGAARSIQCQVTLRDVTLDFLNFADPSFHEGRGDDEALGNKFRLTTFQDQQYGIDEFWQWGSVNRVVVPDIEGNNPMRCAEVSGDLTLRRGIECVDGAVSPAQKMSYGFNRRLHRAEYIDNKGRLRTTQVYLDVNILSESNVPLAWDVDGNLAFRKRAYPGYSAPALGSLGAYANERFWYPDMRHNGALNIAFIDGHVDSSRDPLDPANGFRWKYQPIGGAP